MLVTLSGIVRLEMLPQFSKALPPMAVTKFGMVTLSGLPVYPVRVMALPLVAYVKAYWANSVG